MNTEPMESQYVRVRDNDGNELVCPLNEFTGNGRGLGDSEDCVESEVVGRYAGRLKVVDAVQ